MLMQTYIYVLLRVRPVLVNQAEKKKSRHTHAHTNKKRYDIMPTTTDVSSLVNRLARHMLI